MAKRTDGNHAAVIKALRDANLAAGRKLRWPEERGLRTCARCGIGFKRYIKTAKYCSRACSVAADINRLRAMAPLASRLPRPARKKIVRIYGQCPVCQKPIYNRKVQTCSKACGYSLRKSKTRKTPPPNKTCLECGGQFHSYTKTRLFCSYHCHLANGGAFRAGVAATAARMKYGAKKDQNHSAIVGALRDCGIAVYDLSNHGNGLPDCIAWVKEQWRLVEIKNPKTGYGKRGLNKVQRKWLGQWRGGPVFILKTVDQALEFAAGKLEAAQIVTSEMCVGERE